MAQITVKNKALFINHLLFFLKESTTTRRRVSSSCLSSPPRQTLQFQLLLNLLLVVRRAQPALPRLPAPSSSGVRQVGAG